MSPTGVTLVIMGVAGVVLAVSATGAFLNRRERSDPLAVRPLDELTRRAYATQWRSTQERFPVAPQQAVHDADRLVAQVMQARGYPVDARSLRGPRPSRQAEVVQHYRAAHEVAARNDRGAASDTDLRAAMLHFRALLGDLLESDRERRRRTDASS